MKQARDAGWTLSYWDAHWWGKVSCPEDEHIVMIDRTARGGETKAKEAAKKIRNCGHGTQASQSSANARQEQCETLLNRAENLIAGAAANLERAEARYTAEAELERLALLLDTAGANVDMAEQEQALDRAADFEDAPEAMVIEGDLADASRSTEQADGIQRQIHRSTVQQALKNRIKVTNRYITDLRARLVTLQERSGGDFG